MEDILKKNKQKYEIKKSIIGNGIDYQVYDMKILDYLIGYAVGFFLSFIGFQIFFERLLFSLIFSAIIGFIAIKPYKKYMINNRKKKLLLQFKDFLESLTASYSSGKNTQNSFKDTHADMQELYTNKGYITKELEIIGIGIENGFNIEELLNNFAYRSGIDDIKSFANIFESGNRIGSNMKTIICDTKDIISDKIEIEMEIRTTIIEKKTELYIMLAMPFIIILALNGLGDSTFSALSPVNMIIRILVLFIIFIAFFIGKRITDISA